VGLVNQGLRCSECKANVHEKCQNDFEGTCSQNKLPESRQDTLTPEPQRKTAPLKRQKSFEEIDETEPSEYSDDEEEPAQSNAVFLKMDAAKDSNQPKSSKTSPQKKNTNVQQLDNVVGDVIEIMMKNAKSLEERGEGLERLEDNAANLAEKTEIFKKNAEEISNKYWWKSKKLTIAIVAIVVLIVIVIIVVAVIATPSVKV